jgi:protein-S-isoprenylcysteine O-methyltransferase Ste14
MPLYLSALLTGLSLSIACLLFPALRVRLWEEKLLFDWVMVAVCAIGFGWCWWARLHLGRLWSAGVSRKIGHRVIDTGPYSIVRHPIYTGIILGMLAFAAARARPFAFLMALLVTVFFVYKARLEERFLQKEFGEAYDEYRRRVPMLVPFLRIRASRFRRWAWRADKTG